jgi:hypothetical protein
LRGAFAWRVCGIERARGAWRVREFVAPRLPSVKTHHSSHCPTFLATLSSNSADNVTQGPTVRALVQVVIGYRGQGNDRREPGISVIHCHRPGWVRSRPGEGWLTARAPTPACALPPVPAAPAPPRLTQALRMLEHSSTSATNLEKTYDSESFAYKCQRFTQTRTLHANAPRERSTRTLNAARNFSLAPVLSSSDVGRHPAGRFTAR